MKFFAYFAHKGAIYLVVQKTVYLEDVALVYFALVKNLLFEEFHRITADLIVRLYNKIMLD